MLLDLSELDIPARSRLMTSVVAPRAIALVSSLDAAGRGNLAPFSYFTLGGNNPPSLVFCPVNWRDGRPKDTLANIEATGEFVVSVVTVPLAERMNATSAALPPGESEWAASGLTPVPSSRVRPPRVAESPVSLECRLFTVVRHGEGPGAGNYVIGEVLCAHVDDAVLVDGRVDPARLPLVGRLGGELYTRVDEAGTFAMRRP